METEGQTPRGLRRQDAVGLIGLLAALEGTLMLDRGDGVPEWAERLAARLGRDGLLATPGDARALRQSLNDLNHRLRYALGEYDDPPEPLSVP